MLYIAVASLLSLLASAALLLGGLGSPVAAAHLAFAVGILPLIFAAMMHFVPVLTRSRDPHSLIARLPLVAQCTGVAVVAAMQGWVPYAALHAAAGIDLLLAATLLVWIVLRARRAFGRPHPGWRWYAAALAALILALAAILLSAAFPQYWTSFRLIHLHLNPLGFVGLAALGTLPVLLPTALGKPDPEAAAWLQRRLPLAASAVIVIAVGSAVSPALAIAGSVGLLYVFLTLVAQWRRLFGLKAIKAQGAAASLLLASLGGMLALAAGPLHGGSVLGARGALLGWLAGFLLPLVTGALSQLLPVWRWPGPDSSQRQALRAGLAQHGLWRGLLFFSGAAALFIGQLALGGLICAAGMLLFALDLVNGIRKAGATR